MEQRTDKEIMEHAKCVTMLVDILEFKLSKSLIFLIRKSKKKDIRLINDFLNVHDALKEFDGNKAMQKIDIMIDDIPHGHKHYAKEYGILAETLYAIKSYIKDIEEGKYKDIEEMWKKLYS